LIIGYARVSSKEQNLQRQIEALKNYGCDRIFTEKESAKDFERTIYQDLKSKLRFGDIFVVKELSRFGRNKEQIKEEWEWFMKNDIDIVVLDMPILNTAQYKGIANIGKLVSEIVLALLSWLAEEERTRTKQAQAEGIKLAKMAGKFKGRPQKYCSSSTGADKVMYDYVVQQLNNNMSVMDIHKKTDLARNTIYKIKKEVEQNKRP